MAYYEKSAKFNILLNKSMYNLPELPASHSHSPVPSKIQ